MKKTLALLAPLTAAAALTLPAVANASFVLDTGTPTGSGAPVVLSTTQWLAGEFAVTAGTDVVDLSAYLTQGSGQPGDTFTFDIYAASGFIGRANSRPAPVYSATGKFTANGWNTTATNWTPTSTGDYWLALQVASTTATRGLDAPVETSTSTGTVPALAFAYASGTAPAYALSSATPIGLEVTAAAPVPLPPSVWLFGSSVLAGLASAVRRRRLPQPAAA